MGKPVTIYAEHLEPSALEQFESAMEQDFAVKGALMPDAHLGYSLPIGGVVATDGVVVPAWVGYDIGCGMCALRTSFELGDVVRNAEAIFADLYKKIPVGFNVNQHPQHCSLDPDDLAELGRKAFDGRKGFRAIGTLGGGNHFIEIGKDAQSRVWIVIHSGSRGVGHGVATEYMRLASGDGKVREGHYGLGTNTEDGRAYINDMDWCLEFALENRRVLMDRTLAVLMDHCAHENTAHKLINRNHNHAEKKDGLWIHRKGATHAEAGMLGVIPGNMRDGSFIVEGLGNPESLWSSSHGAGRVLGRKQAKRELSVEDFETAMQGVTAKVDAETLDEAPMAYKDIFEVMRLQAGLVKVLHHIKPLINIKG